MPDAFGFRLDIRAQTGTDELIAHLARPQHGVVTRTQLLARGVSRREIGHRIERRRLHPVHRGVYAVGHDRLSREGAWMAVCLTAKGTISHRTAGTAWEILSSPLLEATAPHSRRRPGIRIYRHRLEPDEVTTLEGIPITTVARTILDLASILPRQELERALNEAEVRRHRSPVSLRTLIDRYPRRHGTAALKAILEARYGITRSELEAIFVRLIDASNLERPKLNAAVEVGRYRFECDCVWRAQRLIVELDGRAFHTTTAAFERDRARDRRLQAGGWTVVRVTWRQLRDEPESVVADLRSLLDHDLLAHAVL
jgi:very-short-patch-repair endonuclease